MDMSHHALFMVMAMVFNCMPWLASKKNRKFCHDATSTEHKHVMPAESLPSSRPARLLPAPSPIATLFALALPVHAPIEPLDRMKEVMLPLPKIFRPPPPSVNVISDHAPLIKTIKSTPIEPGQLVTRGHIPKATATATRVVSAVLPCVSTAFSSPYWSPCRGSLVLALLPAAFLATHFPDRKILLDCFRVAYAVVMEPETST